MSESDFLWIILAVIVSVTLTVDLLSDKIRLKTKNKQEPSQKYPLKVAALWTIVWISFGVIFAVVIHFSLGPQKTLEYLTGYALEKSLSVDNMLVFVLIFTSLGIAHTHQRRVLMWGILGAIVMRILFILAGISLLETFHWMVYVLGVILLFSSARMLLKKDQEKLDLEKSLSVRLLGKIIPIDISPTNSSFLKRVNGTLYATPLLVALVSVELTDLAFAMDSIPAVLAITTDSFIVISSNVFAILGLRSLYFLVGGGIEKLTYLKYGLAVLLVFIAIKMLISEFIEIPIIPSLVVVFSILGITFGASVIKSKLSKK